jgi:lysophospholipase L1-like esterase/thioredoxin-like negative regulator of GroEL
VIEGRPGGRLRGPLLALLLLALLLVAFEGALRVVGWGAPPADVLRLPGQDVGEAAITVWDPDLYYRLRPDTAVFGRYHVNRHGFRGPDFRRDKPAGVLRVACAGDSSTFGLGVGDDETWPAFLQRQLGGLLEGVAVVEAVNAGVPGYSTEQTRRQFLRDVLPLQPDLLVVCPTAQNDSSWRANAGDAAVLDANSTLRARLDQFHLTRLLGLGGTDEAFRATGIRPVGTPGARPRVRMDEFAANLGALAEAARGAGAPTVLVVTEHTPSYEQAVPDLAASEAVVLQTAARAGARAVDTRPAFAGYAPYPMFSDGIHFVALGQQLIALETVIGLIGDPTLVDAGARAPFLAAWAAARRHGVDGHAATLAGPDAPPRLLAMIAALRGDDVDARLGAGDPDLPEALRRHDPVAGRLRGPYGGGALVLQERVARAAGRTESVRALAARREQIERHVHPPDPLLTWAGGAQALLAADRERLALLRALVAFDAAIGARPPPRDRRLSRAIEARQANDSQTAVELLDAVLALAPDNTEALYHRGQTLRRLGRREEALADIEHIIAVEPDSALGLFVAGMLSYEQGDSVTAEPLLRRALGLDSTMARARYALARLLIDRGDLDEAERELRMASVLMTDPVDVNPLLEAIRHARRTPDAD